MGGRAADPRIRDAGARVRAGNLGPARGRCADGRCRRVAVPYVLNRRKPRARAKRVLVVDVGGTHVKVLATGHGKKRRVASSATMSARDMVAVVKDITTDWSYDAVSIGYPGVVVRGC